MALTIETSRLVKTFGPTRLPFSEVLGRFLRDYHAVQVWVRREVIRGDLAYLGALSKVIRQGLSEVE